MKQVEWKYNKLKLSDCVHVLSTRALKVSDMSTANNSLRSFLGRGLRAKLVRHKNMINTSVYVRALRERSKQLGRGRVEPRSSAIIYNGLAKWRQERTADGGRGWLLLWSVVESAVT